MAVIQVRGVSDEAHGRLRERAAVRRQSLSEYLRGEIRADRAEAALSDLAATPLRRHPVAPLAWRAWQLRDTHSAFDAAYLALAEVLDLPLGTTDSRLARSHGHAARVIDLSVPV